MERPYHLRASIMTRSRNHNAVAAAAYRAGVKLEHTSEASKKPADYRRRAGVMSAFIEAPLGAPDWAKNREALWNKVEEAEKRKDAQLAREIVLSLPDIEIYNDYAEEARDEKKREFYTKLLRQFVRENFVSSGMIADVALHAPAAKNDDRNFHAHIMLSMRKIEGDGFGAKERRWNSTDMLESWRKSWAKSVNEYLLKHGVDDFIDHRSYAERGLSILPTKPLVKYNAALERDGVETPEGDYNRMIRQVNKDEHRYLERLFEYSDVVAQSDVLLAIERAGHDEPRGILAALEVQEFLLPLRSAGGVSTGLYTLPRIKRRSDLLKEKVKKLHARESFALAAGIAAKAAKKRRDPAMKAKLKNVAGKAGFAAVNISGDAERVRLLGSLKEMFCAGNYDIIKVARTNEGKAAFNKAGFETGVLTYRDFLRRFGERYSGTRVNARKKLILMDGAEQLSPEQDKEIFALAEKLNAKLVYIGDDALRPKRQMHSHFNMYREVSDPAVKDKRADPIDAFLTKSGKARRNVHAFESAENAKGALVKAWEKAMKKKDDRRFIMTTRDEDAIDLAHRVQGLRLERGHLKGKTGKVFTVSYKGADKERLSRDVIVHWDDRIQFKKTYADLGVQAGSLGGVMIHYMDKTLVKMDDGRILKIDLRTHNAFDLGYAGRNYAPGKGKLDKAYIYHAQSNGLDDLPIVLKNTDSAVQLFYSKEIAGTEKDLAFQMYGQRNSEISNFVA